VLGSDVIYSEEAVDDLLLTLKHLSAPHTTIILAAELRNGTFRFLISNLVQVEST
jgi:hypothetical protein